MRDTTSTRSLRGLALDAVSAGLCAGLESKLGISGLKAADNKTVLKGGAMHVRIAQQHAIRAVVDSAVHQENPGKSFEHEAGNMLLASAQNVVGDGLIDSNRAFKAGAHSIVSTVYTSAKGGDVVAGITDAVVAEGLAAVSSNNPKALYRASDFAAPSAAATAMLLGKSEKDMALAGHVATSAITYNEAAHYDEKSQESKIGSIEEEVNKELSKLQKRAEELQHIAVSEHTNPDGLSYPAYCADKLIALAEDYSRFAAKHPDLVATLPSAISIGAKVMIGVATGTVVGGPVGIAVGGAVGLVSGVIAEVQGWITNEIAYSICCTSKLNLRKDSTQSSSFWYAWAQFLAFTRSETW